MPWTVLLVDDSRTVAEVVRMTFINTEFELIHAATAEEGLALVREKSPAMVLVDSRLPGMDGYEFCSQLKTDVATAGIPVMILIGQRIEPDQFRSKKVGALGFFPKPFSTQDLLDQAAMICQSRKETIAQPTIDADAAPMTLDDFEPAVKIDDEAKPTEEAATGIDDVWEEEPANGLISTDAVVEEAKAESEEKIAEVASSEVEEVIPIVDIEISEDDLEDANAPVELSAEESADLLQPIEEQADGIDVSEEFEKRQIGDDEVEAIFEGEKQEMERLRRMSLNAVVAEEAEFDGLQEPEPIPVDEVIPEVVEEPETAPEPEPDTFGFAALDEVPMTDDDRESAELEELVLTVEEEEINAVSQEVDSKKILDEFDVVEDHPVDEGGVSIDLDGSVVSEQEAADVEDELDELHPISEEIEISAEQKAGEEELRDESLEETESEMATGEKEDDGEIVEIEDDPTPVDMVESDEVIEAEPLAAYASTASPDEVVNLEEIPESVTPSSVNGDDFILQHKDDAAIPDDNEEELEEPPSGDEILGIFRRAIREEVANIQRPFTESQLREIVRQEVQVALSHSGSGPEGGVAGAIMNQEELTAAVRQAVRHEIGDAVRDGIKDALKEGPTASGQPLELQRSFLEDIVSGVIGRELATAMGALAGKLEPPSVQNISQAVNEELGKQIEETKALSEQVLARSMNLGEEIHTWIASATSELPSADEIQKMIAGSSGGSLTAGGDVIAAVREAVHAELGKMIVDQVQNIAWDVVPQLAEAIIKKELDRLTADRV